MKYLWLVFFCAAPLWAETSAKDLQKDIEVIREKARETYPYQKIYAQSSEFFTNEDVPRSLKIEFTETITLPALEAILRHFETLKMQMCTPEGSKLAKMNSGVIEKLKEAQILYLSGLKEDNPALRTRANMMAAMEAPGLAAEVEAYLRQLQQEFNLMF